MWNFVVHTHFSVLQKDPETTSTSLSTRFLLLQFSSPLRGITHHAADVLRFGTVNEKPAFKVAVDNRSAGGIFSGGKKSLLETKMSLLEDGLGRWVGDVIVP